jgi:hypothetical protein
MPSRERRSLMPRVSLKVTSMITIREKTMFDQSKILPLSLVNHSNLNNNVEIKMQHLANLFFYHISYFNIRF